MRNEETSQARTRSLYPEFSRLLKGRFRQILDQESATRLQIDEQLSSSPGDDADISVIDTSADYFLQLADSHQKEILEIREALDRMHRGVFGICENCGQTISIGRLMKLPTARLCIDCQTDAEARMDAAFPRSRPKL